MSMISQEVRAGSSDSSGLQWEAATVDPVAALFPGLASVTTLTACWVS